MPDALLRLKGTHYEETFVESDSDNKYKYISKLTTNRHRSNVRSYPIDI